MRKEIKVTIPEPCHEDWNKMTPQEKGRHCKVCDKTVFDFTDKTDEYIVKTFEKNNKLCGRFKGQQLDRPLAYSRKDSTNYLAVAATSAIAFLTFGTQSANAQGEPQLNTEVKTSHTVKGKTAHSILKNKVVSGRVIGQDNLPLANVQVSEKGTNNLSITDENGNYTLKVYNQATLLFAHENYQDFEVLVVDSNSISVEMVENNILSNFGKKEISGTILGENNYRIAGATISIKETNSKVKSDMGGDFNIKASLNDTLLIKGPYHEIKEVKISEKNNYQIILVPKIITKTETFITGDVNTILENAMPVCGMENEESLIGFVGGAVAVSYSTNNNGEPYEYIPTPEELAEQKRLNEIRRNNNSKFYARKFKEALAERKRKRKERRANRNK